MVDLGLLHILLRQSMPGAEPPPWRLSQARRRGLVDSHADGEAETDGCDTKGPLWRRVIRLGRRRPGPASAALAAGWVDQGATDEVGDADRWGWDEAEASKPSFWKRGFRRRSRDEPEDEPIVAAEVDEGVPDVPSEAAEAEAAEAEEGVARTPFWKRELRFRRRLAESVADAAGPAAGGEDSEAPAEVWWPRVDEQVPAEADMPVEPEAVEEPVAVELEEPLAVDSAPEPADAPEAEEEPADLPAVAPVAASPFWQRELRFRKELAEAVASSVEGSDPVEAVADDEPAAGKRSFWKREVRLGRRRAADEPASCTSDDSSEGDLDPWPGEELPGAEKVPFWRRRLLPRRGPAEELEDAVEATTADVDDAADEQPASRAPFWKRGGRATRSADADVSDGTGLEDTDDLPVEPVAPTASFWKRERSLRRARRDALVSAAGELSEVQPESEPEAQLESEPEVSFWKREIHLGRRRARADEESGSEPVLAEPEPAETEVVAAEHEPEVPFWKREIRLGRRHADVDEEFAREPQAEPSLAETAPEPVAVAPEPDAVVPEPVAVGDAPEPGREVESPDPEDPFAAATLEPMVVESDPIPSARPATRPSFEPWWVDESEADSRAPEPLPARQEELPVAHLAPDLADAPAARADEPPAGEAVEEPVPVVVVEPAVVDVASGPDTSPDDRAAADDSEAEAEVVAKRSRRFAIRGRKRDRDASEHVDGSDGWEDFDVEAHDDSDEEPEPEAKPKRRRLGGHRKKRIVGLKVGASQLAAATVVNNGSLQVEQVVREPLERGIVVGGELRDPEALAAALQRFFKKHKLPKKGVRLGLATNRIGVRSFEISGIDDPKQLENAVRFRAQDALPIPLNEAALDYHVLEERVDAEGNVARRVLLVVAYRDLVDRYIEAFRKAGVRLMGIDLEAFAILRALAEPRPEDEPAGPALVVVAVGHDRSTLAVSDGRVCEFTRVLDWGGGAIDVAIARALDATPTEIEPIKHELSLDPDAELPADLSPEKAAKARAAALDQLQAFARELVSSLHFYQTQPGSLEIGEIVLTGGGAHLAGFVDEVARLTGVHVRVGDPLVRVKLGRRVEAPQPVGSLTVAIGLGIED
jgi:type IV pilus assembly protein PilM